MLVRHGAETILLFQQTRAVITEMGQERWMAWMDVGCPGQWGKTLATDAVLGEEVFISHVVALLSSEMNHLSSDSCHSAGIPILFIPRNETQLPSCRNLHRVSLPAGGNTD